MAAALRSVARRLVAPISFPWPTLGRHERYCFPPRSAVPLIGRCRPYSLAHRNTKELLASVSSQLDQIKLVQELIDSQKDWSTMRIRFAEISEAVKSETLWDEDAQRAIQLQKELSRLTDDLAEHDSFAQKFVECLELKELALQESDWTLMDEVLADLANLHTSMESYSLRLLMADPADKNGCFVELRAGSGGTESCDWVAMITRMYTRWAQSAGYTAKVVDEMKGDIAGFKNTTISIAGENAYGWCKYEGGVHRFVRISPFGDGNKRHTSFISVQVFPAHQSAEDGSTGSIDIPPGDIKIETMRSQGAGGQHVNTTDSAVRLTHIPTGIIINCQNERSQHQNRAMAIEMLKAKLYQRKLAEEASARAELRDALPENGWGSQIRTYVLQPYQMVKDLRSGYEQSNVQGVLDGDIDGFLRASLIHFKRKR